MIIIQLIVLFAVLFVYIKYNLVLLVFLSTTALAIVRFFAFIYTGHIPAETIPHIYYQRYPWMRKALAVILSVNIILWTLVIISP